jgi:hypothetical protein
MTALLSTDYADYTEQKNISHKKAQKAQKGIVPICSSGLLCFFVANSFSFWPFCVICVICGQLLVNARGSVTLTVLICARRPRIDIEVR